jgi:hypothetical protein
LKYKKDLNVTERLLMEGELGDLLTRVEKIRDLPEGFYVLYVAHLGSVWTEDRWSAILFSFDEEDETFMPDEARERNMLAMAHVSLVQRIVRVALHDKPDASKADLITALEYYLDNDAFIDFSLSTQ